MTLAKTAVAGPMTLATDKRPLAPEIQARSSLPQGTAEALLEREGSHVVETVEVNVQDALVARALEPPGGRDPVVVARELSAGPTAPLESGAKLVEVPRGHLLSA